MPQTSAERAARWPGHDTEAIDFLVDRGFLLLYDWTWRRPEPGRPHSPRELDALVYLIEEWDFGGCG